VLYALPPLVAAIARSHIEAATGMSVVAEPEVGADLQLVAAETRADLVLAMAEHGELPAACDTLVRKLSDLRVVALYGDVQSGLQWTLHPESRELKGREVASLMGVPEPALRSPEEG
jgi:hypothetical protein